MNHLPPLLLAGVGFALMLLALWRRGLALLVASLALLFAAGYLVPAWLSAWLALGAFAALLAAGVPDAAPAAGAAAPPLAAVAAAFAAAPAPGASLRGSRMSTSVAFRSRMADGFLG